MLINVLYKTQKKRTLPPRLDKNAKELFLKNILVFSGCSKHNFSLPNYFSSMTLLFYRKFIMQSEKKTLCYHSKLKQKCFMHSHTSNSKIKKNYVTPTSTHTLLFYLRWTYFPPLLRGYEINSLNKYQTFWECRERCPPWIQFKAKCAPLVEH